MLKKVELHVHLEGAIRPEIAKQLASKNKIHLPETLFNPDGKSYFSRDFLHFLSVYDVLSEVLKTPEDYYLLTYDYLEQSAKQGVIYTELMYSSDHAERSTGIPSIHHLDAIQQAIDDAEHKLGIIGRIILTAVRHYGVDAVNQVAKSAHQSLPPCVTGFGLGGDEFKYPPELFSEAYHIAHDAGLSCTIHAGEFDSHEKMDIAIEKLPIKRIGHGVMAMNSAHTRERLREKNIALELCPTSNVFLGLFSSIVEHPLPLFFEEGVQISISSDDPPYMNTTIGEEYDKVQSIFNYSNAQMNEITTMAINASFVDEQTKAKLRMQLV
jgi:adenosine deaminase